MMEYYSALKKSNQFLKRHGGDFKCKLLCEGRQSGKAAYCKITTKHFGKSKLMEAVKRSVVVSKWGRGV